jgi:predicted NUDIX family phosphoesterase
MVVGKPTLKLLKIGQGFTPLDPLSRDEALATLFRLAQFSPRALVEEDEAFKQLIPYIIFRHKDSGANPSLFCYTRTTQQGESRLHGKKSIGVGGHVRPNDAHEGELPVAHYWAGLYREMAEEVERRTAIVLAAPEVIGFINDDADAVGRVHLGIVHLCDLSSPDMVAKEPSMADAGFVSLRNLLMELRDRDSFEGWSRHCLRGLAAMHGIV